ncbi:unnamed protein product [Acanthoscelides obtectus]|uniref:Uncharacterized protein n=1 Tax=Acanthoscelides obtectus TaxID=200917 RepID=A0A9P0Q0W7_ACAOB|nr:unnamed protein product [Acanthoscelides obtectus]CAK1682189.1 hypothetical protein AOBTE_LOCUS33475 [Acanthoscelides obtectus]
MVLKLKTPMQGPQDSPVDDWLFGRDLEDRVKQSKSLVQISKELRDHKQPSSSTARALNSQSLPRSSQLEMIDISVPTTFPGRCHRYPGDLQVAAKIISNRNEVYEWAASTALPDQLWRKTAVPTSSRKEASTAGPTRAEREISPMNTEVGETAGRLKLFYANWCKITSDKHVLSWIKKPRPSHIPKEPKCSPTELGEIENNIKKCLSTGALKKVRPLKDQFLSNIFVTPKPDGSQRLILNLKSLNDYISVSHFKLEEHKTLESSLHANHYL